MMKASEIKYLCPNCFNLKTVNDVMFMRSAVKKGPDHVKRRYWELFHPASTANDNTRCLADWRSYPEDMRIIRNGVVTGINDYNGDELRIRICPDCRFPTGNPMSDSVVILFWDEKGADLELGEKAIRALHGWIVEELPADPNRALLDRIRAVSPEGAAIELPIGLVNKNGPLDEAVFNRYIRFSGAAAIMVKLEKPGANGLAADLAAIDTLLSFTETVGFRGEITLKPAAVFINASPTTPETRAELIDRLEVEHHNFMNSLGALIAKHKLFFSSELDRGLKWLFDAANSKEIKASSKTGGEAPSDNEKEGESK